MHKYVTAHVDRIFRGGNGLPVRDASGEIISQPVFNKDQIYYVGFIKARDFIDQQLSNGISAEALIDFLLSGKFDPTNEAHMAYLRDKHSIGL